MKVLMEVLEYRCRNSRKPCECIQGFSISSMLAVLAILFTPGVFLGNGNNNNNSAVGPPQTHSFTENT